MLSLGTGLLSAYLPFENTITPEGNYNFGFLVFGSEFTHQKN
jgi:hypothetical protein